MNTNTKDLFPITMAAAACGVSRSTLMRLEEKGLLTPVYTAPDSGRRYYDNHNVSRILQIQRFQEIGFSTAEIYSYYASNGDAEENLELLEEKAALFQRNIEELRIRAQKLPDMSVQIMQLPEYVCAMESHRGLQISDKYNAMYGFHQDCVRKGLVLSSEPLFVINHRTDYLEGRIQTEPYDFDTCVPLQKNTAPADAVRLPSCTVLSVLYYGNYENTDQAYLRLGEEAKKRALTPTGYPRMMAIVAPYTGREINTDYYCSRLVLPVS